MCLSVKSGQQYQQVYKEGTSELDIITGVAGS